MYRKILVANDGSEGAFRALSAACNLALRYDAELHMITVEEIPRFPASIDEVEGEIESADRRFAPVISKSKAMAAAQGLTLHCHLLPGHAVSTIVEFCRERGFDVLVTGFMGHSQLYNRIVGSTTDRLVDLAPCTVIVVK
jgi:nucleotide-binding universal stress UspA family protein